MSAPGTSAERIQAYLGGRLSSAESRELEDRLPREPELVRDVEDALRFREGLEALRDRGELAALVRAPRRARSYWAFAGALAAGVASVAIFLGWQFLARAPIVSASIDALAAGNATPPVTAHYTFAATRQAAGLGDFELPVTGVVELRVLASGAEDSRPYQATLTVVPEAAPAATIGTARHLLPDPDGFVRFYADAARVAPGDYALTVTAESGTDAPSPPFRFRLVRPAAAAR